MFRFNVLQALLMLPAVASLAVSERSEMAKARLFQALASPSGKLTLSPEIVIPEPSDPTAILLQASKITAMSETMRTQAKANAALVSGPLTALKTFCSEQEQARGNFPGPIPVIYGEVTEDLASIADAGAEGVLVAVCDGNEIKTCDDLDSEGAWVDTCKAALEAGLQPIPEISIADSTAADWKEADIEAIISKISEKTGEEPVSVLLSINAEEIEEDDDEEDEVEISLPAVPKTVGKKIPILGSVRAKAGENRMGEETSRFKDAGFTGALLRVDCIPVKSLNQDLEFVSEFWNACIGDLKSVKSKSFQFQTRNYLEKSAPIEWMKYQKSVLDSGALGEAEDNVPMGLDPSSGDYKGF